MSKATAKLTKKKHLVDSQSELDETVPLPLLPDEPSKSTEAANDAEYLLSDKSVIQSLDRLVTLAESIVRRLDHISEALATSESVSAPNRKKRAQIKK